MFLRLFWISILFTSFQSTYAGWGFFAHKKINRLAVFTIPEPELFQFYKYHIDFIGEHAVDPDKRRYAVQGEAEKHYIDIDHYIKNGEDPFLVMPKKWDEAVEKFSEDTLKKYGISPWNIQWMLRKLTKAFQEKDLERILKYSAELGHYIGDAHVPLHTTENYNGQLTNQKGIHGFWESRIPELLYDEYDFITGKAKYIDYPLMDTWNFVEHSFRGVDSVLNFEKQLSNDWPDDKKYAYEKRGQVTMKVYSADFSKEYSKRLNGMQERRMKASIKSIGSYWFTAWVNAGQPDLSTLYVKEHEKKRMKSIDEIDDPRISSEKVQSRLHQN